MTGPRTDFRWTLLRWLVFALLGYAAACATVSVLYLLLSNAVHDGWADVGRSFLAGCVITAMTAFPGYAGLRAALWGTGSRQMWRFAAAGGANGLIALAIFQGRLELEPWFVGMGLAAGAVYWWFERRAWTATGRG